MNAEKAREIVELHAHLEPMAANPVSDVTRALIPYAEAKGYLAGFEDGREACEDNHVIKTAPTWTAAQVAALVEAAREVPAVHDTVTHFEKNEMGETYPLEEHDNACRWCVLMARLSAFPPKETKE